MGSMWRWKVWAAFFRQRSDDGGHGNVLRGHGNLVVPSEIHLDDLPAGQVGGEILDVRHWVAVGSDDIIDPEVVAVFVKCKSLMYPIAYECIVFLPRNLPEFAREGRNAVETRWTSRSASESAPLHFDRHREAC